MKRASNPEEVKKLWSSYGLPEDMRTKRFLDVGCWGGGFVQEAIVRGSHFAVGVDSVDSFPDISSPFMRFLRMDIYSPSFLSLPRFHVVLCAGVFYHVPDPVGLLHRLKAVIADDGVLILESAILGFMNYCKENSFDNNYSNWYVPDMKSLDSLMREVGFNRLEAYHEHLPYRIVSSFEVDKLRIPKKYLPRRKEYMDED